MLVDDDKWYTQRGARLQGPYSRLTIHRYLLLGRIKNSDRVSRDGKLWEPITQVPQLIPEELLDLGSDHGWRNFLQAREDVDERRGAGTESHPTQYEREPEPSVLKRMRRDWMRALSGEPEKPVKTSVLPVSLFGVTLAIVLVLAVLNYSGHA
jgi:hypothetical protein